MMALTIRNSQLYAELESQAVMEERNRLAREVHDGLAQSLGFLNFKMQQVDRLLAREQWEVARQALREMREGVQDLYTEVRLTIQDLRWPSSEDDQGLDERLHQYVTAFAARTNLDVSLEVDGEPHLSPQEEAHLFRIVQEALANVRKHAQAQRVWVRLRAGPEETTLEVEDDGKGLSPAAYPQDSVRSASLRDLPDIAEHFGLRIMQERAEAMGGRLSLRSVPGQGTRLQVTVGICPTGS
jgi:signal transduction histidine kinase